MGAVTFLLLVIQAGNPVPLFALPMPDAQACAINMAAMGEAVNDQIMLGCFDLASQVVHIGKRHVKPRDGEEEMK